MMSAMALSAATAFADSSTFDQYYTYQSSVYAQSDQAAYGAVQLTNGTLVSLGVDGYMKNNCPPFTGGAYFVAQNSSGTTLWQRLVANCNSAKQGAHIGRAKSNGNFFFGGFDLSNPNCSSFGGGCAWIGEMTSLGVIKWQSELQNDWSLSLGDARVDSAQNIWLVGSSIPSGTTTYNENAFITKLSPTGAVLIGPYNFPETSASFPGALSGSNANIAFNSATLTLDGGVAASGNAEIKISTGTYSWAWS
jgi:hypothetical protein